MKAFGYLRISHDPDGKSQSVAKQRQLIISAATARGHKITRWFQDPDLSAYRRGVRRPDFERMVAEIRAGSPERAIWVWELSRQNRRAVNSLGLLDELEQLGVVLHSVTQGDSETSRLPFRMYAIFDEEESRKIGRRVSEAHAFNARAGRPVSPHRAYGFDYDRVTKTLTINQEEARVVRAVVADYLDGRGPKEISRRLNDGSLLGAPVLPLRGEEWGSTSVARLLSSPSIAGWVTYRGELIGDEPTMPAIIDPATWERVAATRKIRARASRRPSRSEGQMLYGLIRCGGCHGPMTINDTSAARPSYRCSRAYNSGRTCPARASVSLPDIDTHVSRWFFGRLEQRKIRTDIEVDESAPLRGQVARLESAIARLMDAFAVDEQMSRDVFRERLAEYEARIEVMRSKIDAISVREHLQPELPADLDARWDDVPVRIQREILTAFIEAVTVTRAPRGTPPEDRITITPR